jgi:hypothetical protein
MDIPRVFPNSGLQELTSDISQLVNLRVLKLELGWKETVDSIPDSISCLQQLEELHLRRAEIIQLPHGLATLNNLARLELVWCAGLRFPRDLQVSGLGP